MTAEVIVMNRLAVGVAADSAVTIGATATKIYTSADKLFQLSEVAPVAILVYGSGDLGGVPWETIVKLFRRQLGSRVFDRLEEYVTEFLAFLRQSTNLFTSEVQREFILGFSHAYFTLLQELLKERLENVAKGGELSEDIIRKVFSTMVNEMYNNMEKEQPISGIDDGCIDSILNLYEIDINKVIKEIFGEFPRDEQVNSRLTRLIALTLTRRRIPLPHSGIVVAGFGETEHFPSFVELVIRGIAADQVLFYESQRSKIGDDADAYVAPFAQQEMVATFMDGIDPDLKTLIEVSTKKLFNDVANVIINEVKQNDSEYGRSLEGKILPGLEQLLKELPTSWDENRIENYSLPVMDIVSVLPKDELAAMAESLVNLTKFKRRVSRQQETVGGPIDVAVITKGDGFVWIKRKHYFPSDLNPRFLSKYYGGETR